MGMNFGAPGSAFARRERTREGKAIPRGCAALSVLGIQIWLASLAVADAQVIDTVAGGDPNKLPALSANLSFPRDVAFDAGGNLLLSVSGQNRVFRVNGSGQLTVVAGNGFRGFDGDGGPATSAGHDNVWDCAGRGR